MRTLAAAATAAAVAAFLAGCGGQDEAAPPEQPAVSTARETARPARSGSTSYARQLNALCARALVAHERVGASSSPEDLLRDLPKTNVIDHRLVAGLRRLRPSPTETRKAGRLLYLYSALADMQDTAYVHLKRAGPNGYFQYMSTALVVRGQAEKLAKALGAPACAQRPSTR